MPKQKKHKSKRDLQFFTDNCNVKYFVLNQIFYGDKDDFINYFCSCMSIKMYEGTIGYIRLNSDTISFDLSNKGPWNEKRFQQRIKHAKVYFRKSRGYEN